MDTADRGAEGKQRQDPAVPTGCAEVRDFLPLISEREVPSEVGAHLDGCAECSAEAEFVSRVASLRPDPPASILPSVLARAARRPPLGGSRRRNVSWGLSAAAVVVLALGVGVLWDSQPEADSVWTLALDPEPATWYGDEWMVAGGPVPEALTDDVLSALLEEMDP